MARVSLKSTSWPMQDLTWFIMKPRVSNIHAGLGVNQMKNFEPGPSILLTGSSLDHTRVVEWFSSTATSWSLLKWIHKRLSLQKWTGGLLRSHWKVVPTLSKLSLTRFLWLINLKRICWKKCWNRFFTISSTLTDASMGHCDQTIYCRQELVWKVRY